MNEQNLLILTSPPASGKTYWISRFQKEIGDKKILVISPLRALADECRMMWGDQISVMTPEEWIGKKVFSEIVIIDEFHLFFYWGDSFRPLMWEMFWDVSLMSELTILLTATLSDEMRREITNFQSHFDSVMWIDCGNQKLKFKPEKYIKVPSKNWIKNYVQLYGKGDSVKLIFCQFRNEVFQWEKDLALKGYNCISCVGGESKFMARKLSENPRPDFIISTTVLSHGVNLPVISEIFFTYKVQNLDFWIQMIARGGRRGDSYQVFALETPYQLDWNQFSNFFQLLKLNFKIFFKSFDFF